MARASSGASTGSFFFEQERKTAMMASVRTRGRNRMVKPFKMLEQMNGGGGSIDYPMRPGDGIPGKRVCQPRGGSTPTRPLITIRTEAEHHIHMKGMIMAKKRASKAKTQSKRGATPRAKAKSKSKPREGQYNPALDGVITHTEFA